MIVPPCARSWAGFAVSGIGSLVSPHVTTDVLAFQMPAWLNWQNAAYAGTALAGFTAAALTIQTMIRNGRKRKGESDG